MGKELDAENILADLNKKMRDFDQNYLELAISYINDGMDDEALNVLSRFKGKNPLILYYLGYLHHKQGNFEPATKLFREGSGLPVDYVFPFRLETIRVLNLASELMPDDAKPWYYLGNLLYDKQPEKAIEAWENAVRADPSMAIAHRNLGWGYYYSQGDGHKAISAYEKAISLEKNEPLYYSELDALYEMSNSPIAKRLKLFEGSNEVVKKRDDSFIRQIVVLTLAGQPEKAIEYLSGKTFSYREGSSRVREVIIDAHLMMGNKYMAEKNYSKALEHFLAAQVPDEEGGSERSLAREVQVDHHIGLAYDAMGNRAKARNSFNLSVKPEVKGDSYIKYYQGLSHLKLGNKARASEIFRDMIEIGNRQIISDTDESADFFAKFGEQEAKNVLLSNAYLLKGLGHKGLGETGAANENLHKAVELSAGNLYANVELSNQ